MTNSVPPPKKPKHKDDCIYPFSVVPEMPIMPPTYRTDKESHSFFIVYISILLILTTAGIGIYLVSNNWTLLFLVAIASAYLISKPYLEKLAWRIA